MSMFRSLSFALALLSAFLARPTHAGHRTVYGTFTGTPSTYPVLEETADGAQANEVGLRFTAPKWDGKTENGAHVGFDRLQSVVIETNLLLIAAGRYENTSGQPRPWWMHDQGIRAWYSLGGVACGEIPEGVNVFGGNFRTWSYAGRDLPAFDGTIDYSGASGGSYVGVGSQTIVERLWIDPRRVRALRALCGPGAMDIHLNVRSAYAELFTGHWLADAETNVAVQGLVENSAVQVRVTFVYADPGDPVYAHTVSPWQEVGYLPSPDMELDQPSPGVGYASFVGAPEDDVWVTIPRMTTPTTPDEATLEVSQRAWSMFGVENVANVGAVCGGNSLAFIYVGAPFDRNGVGFNAGVGSAAQLLDEFDGDLDYHGDSGISIFGTPHSWMDHDLDETGYATIFTTGDTPIPVRLQVAHAAFVPLTETGIFGWWYRAMIHAQARVVLRELL